MTGKRLLTIGSRGSDLALWQARHVQALLGARFPGRAFPIEIIRTSGDRIQDKALYKVEDKGFFTKEIEGALLERRIDIAVHSLKDLPTESSPGLAVGAVPEREDPHDVWISCDGRGPREMAAGSRVGTSSLRRRAQLSALRPDLSYEDLRGNVPTRLQKLQEGRYEAVVLAKAGLYRLGLLPQTALEMDFEWLLPAPGQGALGIQVRAEDDAARDCVAILEDPSARLAVTAERSFLHRLQGGCLVPVGAHATVDRDRLRLQGMVADLSGNPIFRGGTEAPLPGPTDSPLREEVLRLAETVGEDLADQLLAQGAGPVLDRVRAFLRDSVRPEL